MLMMVCHSHDNKIENLTLRSKTNKIRIWQYPFSPGTCGLKVPKLLPISGLFYQLESTEAKWHPHLFAFTPIAQVYIGRKPLFSMTESNPEQIRQIPSWISSAALHQTLLGESWGPPWDAQSGQRDLPSSHLSDPKTKKPEEESMNTCPFSFSVT